MRIDVITIFPDMIESFASRSLLGKARERGLLDIRVHDLRSAATDPHRSVDDTPFGGGAGMVLRPDVMAAAIDSVAEEAQGVPRLLMSARGRPLTQARVRELAAGPGVLVVCGRFEGVDERVIEARELEEVAIGDFVLSGGEPAAIVLMDAVVRLLPGVMGSAASGDWESFEQGLLEHPHYTRPRVWEGREIPEILLSGDHRRIEAWRREQAIALTQSRRPEIYEAWIGRKRDDKQ